MSWQSDYATMKSLNNDRVYGHVVILSETKKPAGVAVTKAPTNKVSGLKLVRSKSKMTASWKNPSNAFSTKSNSRWGGVRCAWGAKEGLYTESGRNATPVMKTIGKCQYLLTTITSQTGKLSNQFDFDKTGQPTSDVVTIDRKYYYPNRRTNSLHEVYHYVYRRSEEYNGITNVENAKKVELEVFGEIPPLYTVRILDKTSYNKLNNVYLVDSYLVASKNEKRYYEYKQQKADMTIYMPTLQKIEFDIQPFSILTSYQSTDKDYKSAALALKKAMDAGSKTLKDQRIRINIPQSKLVTSTTKKVSSSTWNDSKSAMSVTYTFKVPVTPSISNEVNFDSESYKATFSITAKNDDTGSTERFDTYYITSIDSYLVTSVPGNAGQREHWVVDALCGSFTSESKDVVFVPNTHMGDRLKKINVAGREISRTISGLFKGEFVKVSLYAYNRGFAGNSKPTDVRMFTYAHPSYQFIHDVIKTGDNYIIVLGNTHTTDNAATLNNVMAVPDTGWGEYYYTKTVTLQVMKDVRPDGSDDWTEDDWTAYISRQASGSWTDVVTVDATQRQMQVVAKDLEPTQVYQRTYMRIAASNGIYPDVYSLPFLLKTYRNIPSCQTETVKILAAESIEDGSVMKVALAWKKTKASSPVGDVADVGAQYNSDGCELSWSENVFGWYSSSAPSVFDISDSGYACKSEEINCHDNGVCLSVASFGLSPSNYPEGACCYITGLTAGKEYYLRARRFLDDGRDTRSYGPYSSYTWDGNSYTDVEIPVTMAVEVKNVKINVPESAPEGQNVSVGWGYESDAVQKKWILNYGKKDKKTGDIVNSDGILSNPVMLADGEGEITNRLLQYLEDDLKNKLIDGKLYLQVRVSLDGANYGTSNVGVITYSKPPEAAIANRISFDASPIKIRAYTNSVNARMNLILRSAKSNSRWGPTGDEVQAEGEILYTASLPGGFWTRVWKDGAYVYSVDFDVPVDVLLFDGGEYEAEVFASDDNTNLDSRIIETFEDENGITQTRLSGVKQTISIDWKHKAYPPSNSSYVEAGDWPNLVSVIRPVKPKSYYDTDVCDVYRVTPDGAKRIASGVKFNSAFNSNDSSVMDAYAPYSSYEKGAFDGGVSGLETVSDPRMYEKVQNHLRYRLVTRTKEGDLAWIDVGYHLDYYGITFDWRRAANDTHNVETYMVESFDQLRLPYNISYSDSFTKDFEARKHMSGEYDGYWSEGVHRTSSLSTEIVKITGAKNMEKIRSLAQHDGPVFVRTPNGVAFCANVNVSEISYDYGSLTASVKFDAEEIALTSDFYGDIL